MILNFRLIERNIRKILGTDFILKHAINSEYKQFMISEYSRARLTHDTFDNFYYHDPSKIAYIDEYGIADEPVRSKSR